MVKTRRSITEEKDRYGGYIPRTDVSREPVEVDLDVDPDTELTFSRRTPVIEERERRTYAPVERPASPYSGVPAPTRRKRTVPRESEDIMPSIKTQAYMAEKPQQEERRVEMREPKKSVMSAKAKAMLCIYVAAVVLLAVVVIATGLALSSGAARVSALEEAVAGRNAVIAEQMSELATLENESTLTGMATDKGMVKGDVATEIELLPVVGATEYAPRTNWFDKFCDWLNQLL